MLKEKMSLNLKDPILILDENDDIYENSERNATTSSSSSCSTYLYIIVFLALMIAIPIGAIALVRRVGIQKDDAAFGSAFVFVLISCFMSAILIRDHLYNWYMPRVQSQIVKIILMVPVYSICSWLSLRFYDEEVYFEAIIEIYESIVILSFMNLLIALLGGHDSFENILEGKDPHLGEHKCCFKCCCRKWEMGKEFLRCCKRGVLQFVIVQICNAILIFVFEPRGKYDDTSFGSGNVYTFIAPIQAFSTVTAVYCLLKLFHAVEDDLSSPKNWHPWYKFFCVKGIIFFSFLQGFVISILVNLDIINEIESLDWDEETVAAALQNYIVIYEICILSFLHHYAYPYKECLPSYDDEGLPASPMSALWNILSPYNL